MKKKKILIYLIAVIILLVCWWINLSTKTTQGVTGATAVTCATAPPYTAAGIIEYIQILALIVFFLLAVIAQKYPRPYLRYGILIFAIIFLGFYKKTMLTTGNVLELISGRWWPLAGHIFIYTLFLLILITSLFGKGTYCNYCCPFGAVQQLIYKASPFKLKFDEYITSQFRKFRYIFLWLVLAAALVLDDFRIASLDPFSTMFSLKGTWLAWIQLGLILGFSLLYYRIWCYHFCPVGAAVHIIGSIPGLKKFFYKEPLSVERTTLKNMFKKHTTYIFLIAFLLILIATLSIIIINLKKQAQEVINLKKQVQEITDLKKEEQEPVQIQLIGEPKKQVSYEEEEKFIKYGIKPKEARYYE